MIVRYIGNNIIQTVYGNLGKNDELTVDENAGAILIAMKDKNNNKMFEEVVEKKKSKKVKMIIEEREGE